MMRHHHRKILPSSFPHKEGDNTVNVEPTLAHVVKLQGSPEIENDSGQHRKLGPFILPSSLR